MERRKRLSPFFSRQRLEQEHPWQRRARWMLNDYGYAQLVDAGIKRPKKAELARRLSEKMGSVFSTNADYPGYSVAQHDSEPLLRLVSDNSSPAQSQD